MGNFPLDAHFSTLKFCLIIRIYLNYSGMTPFSLISFFHTFLLAKPTNGRTFAAQNLIIASINYEYVLILSTIFPLCTSLLLAVDAYCNAAVTVVFKRCEASGC